MPKPLDPRLPRERRKPRTSIYSVIGGKEWTVITTFGLLYANPAWGGWLAVDTTRLFARPYE